MIFAKSEEIQQALKNNWKQTVKNYYAIVHGKLKEKKGLIESFLTEDEDYVVHSSSEKKENSKLAQTEYTVVKETMHFSVVKINLLTGKKNQIRVHMAELGNPVVGDAKYGKQTKHKDLYLHSFALVLTHPVTQEKLRFQADVPDYFKKIVDYKY